MAGRLQQPHRLLRAVRRPHQHLSAVPHLLVDDGTAVRVWLQVIKGTRDAPTGLSIAVDQSFHVICLFGAALLANA